DGDWVEESRRACASDRLPLKGALLRMGLGTRAATKTGIARLKERLVSLGYQEVITYSFVEPGLMSRIDSNPPAIALQNPISSDMAVMRTRLWPGLLSVLRYNANRQQDRVRIFECGQVFLQQEQGINQPSRIAGLLYGSAAPKLWSNMKKELDFFDIKGDVEALIDVSRNRLGFRFSKGEHATLHRGQSALIEMDGRPVGLIGALDPALQRELDIDGRVYLFE